MSAREHRKPDNPRPPLTRKRIVSAALGIVDQDGYKALSMRRLGAELEVDPMAVYYHIPNKSALWDAIVEAVMSEIDLSVDDPSRSVPERLCAAMGEYRRVLLSHPQAFQVMSSRGLNTQAAFRPVEVVLGILRDAGFQPAGSLAAVDILAAFVRGSVSVQANHIVESELTRHEDATVETMQEMLPPDQFPILNEVMAVGCFIGFEQKFERGISALVKGLIDSFADNDRENIDSREEE